MICSLDAGLFLKVALLRACHISQVISMISDLLPRRASFVVAWTINFTTSIVDRLEAQRVGLRAEQLKVLVID